MRQKTAFIAKTAMMAVLAYVIMLLEFSLPVFPSFLKLDLSEIIVLITSFAMGPIAGVTVEFLKNLLHFLTASTTGGVGDLANFLVGSVFAVSAGICYKKRHTKKSAVISMAIATAAMTVMGALVNYFITLPLYELVLGIPLETIVGWSSEVVPAVKDKFTLVLYAFCPFNLLKGVIVSIITFFVYKYVSPFLKREHAERK